MITKYTEYDVICDFCDCTGAYNSAWDWKEETYENYDNHPLRDCRTKKEIKKRAKQWGWIFKREDGREKHYCPKCWAKGENRE